MSGISRLYYLFYFSVLPFNFLNIRNIHVFRLLPIVQRY